MNFYKRQLVINHKWCIASRVNSWKISLFTSFTRQSQKEVKRHSVNTTDWQLVAVMNHQQCWKVHDFQLVNNIGFKMLLVFGEPVLQFRDTPFPSLSFSVQLQCLAQDSDVLWEWTMQGLSVANEIFLVQFIPLPTHFIILWVAHSHHAPRSALSQLLIPSYTSEVQGPNFLHM